MQATTTKCPTCHMPRMADGQVAAEPIGECAGCGADLCDHCDSFTCEGCDEVFCLSHLVKYDGEQSCPMCAAYWAQEAQRKLKDLFVERMEWRMSRKPARRGVA